MHPPYCSVIKELPVSYLNYYFSVFHFFAFPNKSKHTLEKWLSPSLRQEKDKMSLRNLLVPESNKVIRYAHTHTQV